MLWATEPNHEKLAVMVQLITQRGLNINQISRTIGVYKETVRYWYRNLLKDGFTVQAAPNYEKLGMKRVVMIVEPGEPFESHGDALMYALGELCYVVSFARDPSRWLLHGQCFGPAGVPEFVDRLHGLAEGDGGLQVDDEHGT